MWIYAGPEQLGWPTMRRRIYIVAVRRDSLIWVGPVGGDLTKAFLSKFGCTCQLDGDAFLLDSVDARRRHLEHLACRRGLSLPASRSQGSLDIKPVLPPYMQRHFDLYAEKRAEHKSLSSCFIADLHQSPIERPSCSCAVPVQVTHGAFYSYSKGVLFTHTDH